MNSWKKRNITMVGRIMILIIPNITYVASITNIDKEYVSKFKTMIYKFIWNDKREKVNRETMNQLIFSILSLQCFKHPIHIPSVLFLFSAYLFSIITR
jgi:hypothetical protein